MTVPLLSVLTGRRREDAERSIVAPVCVPFATPVS
jgi:hypothetical protein